MSNPPETELGNTFTGRNVLITGGLGFIGSNLARRLVEYDAKVTVMDSLVPEYGGNRHNISGIENRIRVNISDVRDQHSMRSLVREQDYLFNLAGQTSHMDSMQDPFTDLEINAKAQLSILEACRSNNADVKIVYAGTRQVYGKPETLPVSEKHMVRPIDVNGINKMAGECYHILYHQVYGLRTCSLRLTNTYGPRMRIKDARQTFLGVWIRQVLENSPIEVWGGDQLRDFTFVDDAVDALLRAAALEAANGAIYNLGGDVVISLRDLADVLVEINGSGSVAIEEFPADRKRIDIGDYYADDTKIRAELGWTPKVTLREGLAQTLAFYRRHLELYL